MEASRLEETATLLEVLLNFGVLCDRLGGSEAISSVTRAKPLLIIQQEAGELFATSLQTPLNRATSAAGLLADLVDGVTLDA